jgi:hypothetical protein
VAVRLLYLIFRQVMAWLGLLAPFHEQGPLKTRDATRHASVADLVHAFRGPQLSRRAGTRLVDQETGVIERRVPRTW